MTSKKIFLLILDRLNIFAFIALACTLFSLAGNYLYYADILSSFRFQYLIYLITIGSLNAYLKRKFFGFLFFFGSLINIIIISPYMSPSQNTQKPKLKILYANVLTANTQYSKLKELVDKQNPDVIGLLEINKSWADSLVYLNQKYPYKLVKPESDSFGIAFYSKHKLSKIKAVNSHLGTKSIFAKLNIDDKIINLYLTHPVPPISKKYWFFRNEQYQETIDFLLKEKGTQILFGDFNSVAWSPKVIDIISDLQLKPVTSLKDTWPTQLPPLFRISLDHAFISKNITGNKKILTPIGADHLPILYSFENF